MNTKIVIHLNKVERFLLVHVTEWFTRHNIRAAAVHFQRANCRNNDGSLMTNHDKLKCNVI